MISLGAEDARRIADYFRPIAAPTEEGTGHHPTRAAMEEFRRERAAAVVAALDGPGPEYDLDDNVAAWAARELVNEGLGLRARAHSSPGFDHTRARGGFLTRMYAHDQSPDADALDRLAIALANGIPGLSQEQRLLLVI